MTPIPARCTWGRSRSTRSHTSTSSFLSQKPSRRSPRSVMTITRWVLFCRRHSSSSASSVGHSLCRDVSHSATTSGSSVSPGMRISSHGPGTPAARHLATCSSRLVPSSAAPAARSTRAASGKPSTPFTTPHTRMPIPRQREITASALLRRSARSNSNWGYCRTATPPVYAPYELNLISTPSIDKGKHA